MAKEALFKIVDSEERARYIVKTAQDEASREVREAKVKAKSLVDDAVKSAKHESDRLLNEARAETQGEIDKILAANKEKCKEITEVSGDRFEEAKKFLMERIVK